MSVVPSLKANDELPASPALNLAREAFFFFFFFVVFGFGGGDLANGSKEESNISGCRQNFVTGFRHHITYSLPVSASGACVSRNFFSLTSAFSFSDSFERTLSPK